MAHTRKHRGGKRKGTHKYRHHKREEKGLFGIFPKLFASRSASASRSAAASRAASAARSASASRSAHRAASASRAANRAAMASRYGYYA